MKINLNSGESLTAVLSGAHTTTAPTAKVDYPLWFLTRCKARRD